MQLITTRSAIVRFAFALALAASIVSTPGSWTLRADTDVGRFDGAWVGEMQTTYMSGPCGRQYRLEMSVTRGAATGSASRAGENFTLYGEVGEDGKLTWSATSGRGSATGAGVIDGDAARGEWEDATGQCAGTFSMERTR